MGMKRPETQLVGRLKNNRLPSLSPFMGTFSISEAPLEMQSSWEFSHFKLSANTLGEISRPGQRTVGDRGGEFEMRPGLAGYSRVHRTVGLQEPGHEVCWRGLLQGSHVIWGNSFR